MALVRRDLFNDLFNANWFQNEFQQMFERNVFGNRERWSPAGPAMNVWADDHSVYAEIDLPGIDVAKLDVNVTEGNKLTVQGERPVISIDNAVWHRQSRHWTKRRCAAASRLPCANSRPPCKPRGQRF